MSEIPVPLKPLKTPPKRPPPSVSRPPEVREPEAPGASELLAPVGIGTGLEALATGRPAAKLSTTRVRLSSCFFKACISPASSELEAAAVTKPLPLNAARAAEY